MDTLWLMSENGDFVSVTPGDAESVYGVSGGSGPHAAEEQWDANTPALRDRVMLIRGEVHDGVIYRAEVLVSFSRSA